MAQPPPRLNKPLVGLIAVLCGAGAIAMLWVPGQAAIQGALSRVGMVMGALWLALPRAGQSVRMERMAGFFVAAVLLIVLSRKLILFILPMALVIGALLMILRPKPTNRPPRTF